MLNQATFNQTAYSTTALPTVVTMPAPKKKRGWLPLLTVLFLISYGLMTMLIVEQGRTIESQRVLIRELFRDSTELSALKHTQSQNAAEPAKSMQNPSSATVQSPSMQAPATRTTPTTQTPSTQAQAKQAPSSQAVPRQHQVQKQKQDFQMPSRPASDLADEGRSLISI